jgi:hypothetical protein
MSRCSGTAKDSKTEGDVGMWREVAGRAISTLPANSSPYFFPSFYFIRSFSFLFFLSI